MNSEQRRQVDKRIDAIEGKLDLLHKDVRELVELWNSAKGFIQIVRIAGTTIKWFAGLGIAIGALWALFKTGIHK